MILYFSATGNCKYVAKRISESTGDSILSIEDCIKTNNYNFKDKYIGIISPTYFWALPSITRDFLQKAKFQTDYIYYVATYGTSPGASYYYAEKYIKNKINAFYSVRMPDTWTPIFDLSTPQKIAAFSNTTESEINKIIEHLNQKDSGQYMNHLKSKLSTKIVYPVYESARKTKHFYIEDACIGCGLCEKKCPDNAIEIKDKKPVWVKDKCVMCLRCLHNCPKFAIQYNRKTKVHGQYTNPNVK